jgi:hypothetical protein
VRSIDHHPIDLAGQGGASKAGADGGSHFQHCDWFIENTNRTVGKFDIRHYSALRKMYD